MYVLEQDLLWGSVRRINNFGWLALKPVGQLDFIPITKLHTIYSMLMEIELLYIDKNYNETVVS